MPLEVAQGDDDVGIHHRPANHGLVHIFAAPDGNGHIVGALQTVGNNHMAAGGVGGEAVEIGGFQVIQGVFPGADIHGVGIGQEGLAAQILYEIHHHPGIAGAQIGHIAQLTEVNLDGNILALEVDLIHPGGQQQPCQFLGQGFAAGGAEIGKINLGCHKKRLLIIVAQFQFTVVFGICQEAGEILREDCKMPTALRARNVRI